MPAAPHGTALDHARLGFTPRGVLLPKKVSNAAGWTLLARAPCYLVSPLTGGLLPKGQAPPAGRSSHSRQHVWLGHSARTCPRSTSSTRRTATRRCRALWAMCSMSLSVQSASACAMRSIDLAHFTPPRRPGRASAPLGPPLSACSSDSPWLTRSDSVLGRRCATERTMTITSSKLSCLLLNRADARDARRLEMLADVMTKVLAVSAFFAIRTILMNLGDRSM